MIGAGTCGWTSIYRVCHVVRGLKRAKKGISAGKKRHRASASPGQCGQIPGDGLVGYLSGQPAYDDRGGAEVEQFRNDKGGLGLEARRKHRFLGQKGYILLTDLAHNLLADFYHKALLDSPFEHYGPKRIVRDLLAMPGQLAFEHYSGKLVRVELLSLKQFSGDLAICLKRYCSGP